MPCTRFFQACYFPEPGCFIIDAKDDLGSRNADYPLVAPRWRTGMKLTNNVFSDYERPIEELLDIFGGPKADARERDRIKMRFNDARKIDLDTATIVIASWENRFAAAGGVRAVTQEYAKHLASQKQTVRVLTPLHMGLASPPGIVRPLSVLWLDFLDVRRRIEIFESEWANVKWIYLHCEGFFLAEGGRDRSNPYLYDYDAQQELLGRGSPCLVRDCLFFSAALPKVLSALGVADNVIIHLQDWVTAGAALSVKEAIIRKEIARAVCVLAMHNPYDKDLNPPDQTKRGWSLLSSHPEPAERPSTFLRHMLPLLDAPPATVSREFAVDLTSDPLQTTHFSNHLQDHFKRFGIIGVDNGPFENLQPPFSQSAQSKAQKGQPDAILLEKQVLRKKMIDKLREYRPIARWGDIDFESLKEDVPVFMCVGRFDPGQKGFDIAARAIEIVLMDGFEACFVLTPIIGNAPQSFVDDLQTLAERNRNILIYPFRMEQGYPESQAGCTFSLWPSMYEPFGAVSEFLLRGTPVIARSTGGLRQQVIDFDTATGKGNGILYESTIPQADVEEWRMIQNEMAPRGRMQYPIYRDQVKQLAEAMRKAAVLFRDPAAYGRLLSNVYGSVDSYSWTRAEKEYRSLYDLARR
jgi:glycogen synthase